jgi:hypothetical protein
MEIQTVTTFLQQPGFLIGVLTGFLLATLIAILFSYLKRPPETFEAFTNEAGQVLVSRQALKEQIQRCCEELGDVGKARAAVIHRNQTISIRLHLRVRSNAKLAGISAYLQEQVGTVLRSNLGIENIGPIDIVVTGILPPPREKEASTSIRADEKIAE